MSTRRGISLSTEYFLCCSWNAIFCACEISRSFANHPSKILISKVHKFYTGFTMILQKNRHVCTSKQNLIHSTIRWHREKRLSTSVKYRRFQKKYKKYMSGDIIKLKTTYSHRSHHNGGCNRSLTSRTLT